jgi:hypothetical protein
MVLEPDVSSSNPSEHDFIKINSCRLLFHVCALQDLHVRGSCRYPVDRVPPCARLKSSPIAPDSTPGREGLWCRRVSPRQQTRSRCWRALASPRAPWHRARHSTGKSSSVATCPTAPDPLSVPKNSGIAMCPVSPSTPPDREGLQCRHVSRAPDPPPGAGGLWRRHVPRARHPTWKGSGVAMCPAAPDPPPSVGGLQRRHMPLATGPATRQGRALVSPCVLRLHTHLPVREGSGVTKCPVALSLRGMPVHSQGA